MKRIIPVFLIVLALSACATQMTVLDKSYPATDPDKLTILFNEKPKCNAKQIAFLNTTTAYSWSQDGALQSARKSAASAGADYLVINNTKSMYGDGTGTVFHAVAYKCVKG